LVERGLADKCEGVIVTHLHGDHTFGLEMLGFWWMFVKKAKLPLVLPSYRMAAGLWGMLEPSMGDIQDKDGNPLKAEMHDYFDIRVGSLTSSFLDDGETHSFSLSDDGRLKAVFVPTSHVPGKESCGVELNVDGRTHLFTSDTRKAMSSPLYDTVWHDCQLYDGGAGGVHAFMGDLKKHGDASSMWLMHYNRTPTAEEAGDAKTWCKGFVRPGQVFDL
jgi:hypothetical protein